MTRFWIGVLALIAMIAAPCMAQSGTPANTPAPAPASTNEAPLLTSTEAFVRKLYAWGPDVKVKLGPLGASPAAAFYVVPMEITYNDQVQQGEVYVSKDGKTFVQGDLFDTSADPFANNRAKLHLEGNPSEGPADAKVTLVEFADFECPHCRELHENLKGILMQYPDIRVVYKDFPLTTIHPWANTAAVGGRCVFQQSPEAFWKVHDMIFDKQDAITVENVWDKLVSFATDAGLNADTFKACLSSPDAQKAVDANRADGAALGVNSTPTVYVNGRAIPGGNPAIILRDIAYESGGEKRAAATSGSN